MSCVIRPERSMLVLSGMLLREERFWWEFQEEGLEEGQILAGIKVNTLQGHWGTQPAQRALSLLSDFCDIDRGWGDLGHGYETSLLCSVVS